MEIVDIIKKLSRKMESPIDSLLHGDQIDNDMRTISNFGPLMAIL